MSGFLLSMTANSIMLQTSRRLCQKLTCRSRFHDHQMITSRKDVLGTELLSLPFRKEELEAILEDLMS